MIRVRICTMRCRCHNRCRRSRFSPLGTQILGKRFSISNCRICCASCRSVFRSESASAPCDADATTVAADPDSPHSVPRSWENDSPSATAEYAAHPADPSSACVRASWRSRWRPRSTTRSSVPPGVAQTSVHAHWLPFPLVPSSPGQRGHDKTLLLPHCAPIAALRNLPSRYPQTLFAGSPGDNRIHNDHCPAPFSPSLHGWFGTTKLTRVWEPALLWNQLRSLRIGPESMIEIVMFQIVGRLVEPVLSKKIGVGTR